MARLATEPLPYWDGKAKIGKTKPRFELWDGPELLAARRSRSAILRAYVNAGRPAAHVLEMREIST